MLVCASLHSRNRTRRPAGVNHANRSAYGGKVETVAFDRPRSELDDLFCWKSSCYDESANYGSADAE